MPRDRSAPIGAAEDLRSRASLGRRFTLHVYRRTDAWNALADRGPRLARPTGVSGSTAEESVVYGGQTIRLVLTPSIFSRTGEDANDLQTLLSLSESPGCVVYVVGDRTTPEWPKIRRVDISDSPTSTRRVVRFLDPDPGHEAQFDAQVSSIDAVSRHFAEVVKADVCPESITLALANNDCHATFLVTDEEALLKERHTNHRSMSTAGLVTVREAICVSLAILRGRKVYSLASPGSSQECSETGFSATMANIWLPRTLAAFRSALSPERREGERDLAEHLESVLGKFESLLALADECGRLQLSEGTFGGGNAVLGRYVRFTENALTEFAGVLDAIAYIAAERSGRNGKPASITWGNLLQGAKPYFNDLDGEAAAIRKAVSALSPSEVAFALAGRHYCLHKSKLPGSVGRFERPGDTEECAMYSVLHLGAIADERGVEIPETLLGSFDDGITQPQLLMARLVKVLREVVEAASGCLDSTNDAWFIAGGDNVHDLRVAVASHHARYWLVE